MIDFSTQFWTNFSILHLDTNIEYVKMTLLLTFIGLLSVIDHFRWNITTNKAFESVGHQRLNEFHHDIAGAGANVQESVLAIRPPGQSRRVFGKDLLGIMTLQFIGPMIKWSLIHFLALAEDLLAFRFAACNVLSEIIWWPLVFIQLPQISQISVNRFLLTLINYKITIYSKFSRFAFNCCCLQNKTVGFTVQQRNYRNDKTKIVQIAKQIWRARWPKWDILRWSEVYTFQCKIIQI